MKPSGLRHAFDRRAQHHRRIGEAGVEDLVEAAKEERQVLEPGRIFALRAAGEGLHPLGRHAAAAERGEGLREGHGRGPQRQPGRQREARGFGKQASGQECVVAEVPGLATPAQQRGFRERAGQVQDLERQKPGYGPTAAGQAPGQLEGRGHRRREQHHRPDPHGTRS